MQRHAQWQQKRIHSLSRTRRFFAAFSLKTPYPHRHPLKSSSQQPHSLHHTSTAEI